MSKVNFTYGKGGKSVSMARRTAEALRKLGYGTYADEGYQTRMLTAAPPPPPATGEILISETVRAFAEENGIDVVKLKGTGKDGRINKSDVEAAIVAKE